jgi:hypothetical protein
MHTGGARNAHVQYMLALLYYHIGDATACARILRTAIVDHPNTRALHVLAARVCAHVQHACIFGVCLQACNLPINHMRTLGVSALADKTLDSYCHSDPVLLLSSNK